MLSEKKVRERKTVSNCTNTRARLKESHTSYCLHSGVKWTFLTTGVHCNLICEPTAETVTSWRGDWRGKAVQSHLQKDCWWSESISIVPSQSRSQQDTHYIFFLLCPHQDMQVCANELQTIMKNVLSKRELRLLVLRWTCVAIVSCFFDLFNCFCFADGELKTEGFSLETCRSMIALMDVS